MDDQVNEPEIQQEDLEVKELSDRRDFLRSLGKWSTAAITAILVSESTPSARASGWANTRGSSVIEGAGGLLNSRGGRGSRVNRRV